MRSLTASIVLVALLGLAVAEYKQVGETAGTNGKCKDNNEGVQVDKCGSCSDYNLKIFMDDQKATLVRYETTCTSCNNSKTPSSSPI